MTAYNPAADDVVRRLPPRVVSTRQLLRLEQISRAHGFSQNLDPAWMAGVISDEGRHILTPALTHPSRRADEAAHVRSVLRVQLRTDLPWTDRPVNSRRWQSTPGSCSSSQLSWGNSSPTSVPKLSSAALPG